MNSIVSSASFERCMERVRGNHIPLDSTTAKILKALGGPEAFCQLPVLEFQAKFNYGSYPADGIRPEDMSHPLMRMRYPGIPEHVLDSFAIRSKVRLSNGKIEAGAEHVFQRYRDDHSIWASGHHFGFCSLSYPCEYRIEVLGRLVKGEIVDGSELYCCPRGATVSL